MTEGARVLLLVEDDPNDVEILLHALGKEGFPGEVRVARDGEEAVEVLAGPAPRPGLVVLDLKLPRKSGFEVLFWLRAQPAIRETPVAILTSSREESDVKRAMELGANWYLVKATTLAGARDTARTIRSLWPSSQPPEVRSGA